MTVKRAMSGHQSAKAKTVTWLTPRWIIDALGGADAFDLDPCAAPSPRLYPTAKFMNEFKDGDGLQLDWRGIVWMNPPYSSHVIARWLRKLADHGSGIALIFARTETDAFRYFVWQRATALLFIYGRLTFVDTSGMRAKGNAGAPSVLVAYGDDCADRLEQSGIDGAFIRLPPSLRQQSESSGLFGE